MSYLLRPDYDSDVRLDGKTAMVTGSSSGLGKEDAEQLYKRGARVIMACRNATKAELVRRSIMEKYYGITPVADIKVVHLELTSMASVRRCAQRVLDDEARLDVLVNNAGVAIGKRTTEDGFDHTMSVNYIGHFLLSLLLLPLLQRSAPARIVNVSSLMHSWAAIDFEDINYIRDYSIAIAYSRSKLAVVMLARELARRLQENDIHSVHIYTPHPDAVRTDIGRHLDDLFPGMRWIWYNIISSIFTTTQKGCTSTMYCAIEAGCANETGLYYRYRRAITPGLQALDNELNKKLWDVTCKMVGLSKKNLNNIMTKVSSLTTLNTLADRDSVMKNVSTEKTTSLLKNRENLKG